MRPFCAERRLGAFVKCPLQRLVRFESLTASPPLPDETAYHPRRLPLLWPNATTRDAPLYRQRSRPTNHRPRSGLPRTGSPTEADRQNRCPTTRGFLRPTKLPQTHHRSSCGERLPQRSHRRHHCGPCEIPFRASASRPRYGIATHSDA